MLAWQCVWCNNYVISVMPTSFQALDRKTQLNQKQTCDLAFHLIFHTIFTTSPLLCHANILLFIGSSVYPPPPPHRVSAAYNQQIFSLGTPIHPLGCLQPPPPPFQFSMNLYSKAQHFCSVHANIIPSTQQENTTAQPKTGKWFNIASHFSLFNCHFVAWQCTLTVIL